MFGWLSRYKVGFWTVLCLLTSLAALTGHYAGLPALAAFGRNLRPMAPAAGWLTLLLCWALVLAASGRHRALLAGLTLAGAAAVGGPFLHSVLVAHDPFNTLLASMGYLAALLALAAVGLHQGAWKLRQPAALVALVPLVTGSLLLFAYAAGMPLVFESAASATSLPTALTLFFLGHALLALAGHDTFPSTLFHLDRLELASSASLWLKRLPILSFMVLASLGGAAGALWMRGQVATHMRGAHDPLAKAEVVMQLRPWFWGTAIATLGAVLLLAMVTGYLVRRHGGMRIRELLAQERERKALAERSKVLMREANDIILLLDLDGRILEANERAQASYGYTLEELLARRGADLRAPGGADDFERKWDWLKASGSGVWETWHRRKDGTEFPVEASGRVVSQGGETYVLSFLRDISERHAQAREIRHLTQLYAALGQVGQAVVWTRDREELFHRVCAVLVEFGRMGTAWIAVVDRATGEVQVAGRSGGPAHLDRFGRDRLGAVVRSGLPCVLDGAADSAAAFPISQAGTVTHLLGVLAPDRNFFGPGEVELLEETALDLSFALDKLDEEALRARAESDLRAAGEEQRRLEAQLQQSQKMESLGSLAGGVAHDLNNVLAAILSLASAHRDDAGLPAPAARAMGTIVTACLRGRGVIKSLLYFARKGLEEERPLDLNALVADITQLLAHTTLKRVRPVMDLEEDLPLLVGDAGALSHAVMNLCVNAVDAMERGGTLTLRTRREPGGGLALAVTDTGEGMAPEVLAKAMDPFFTTKPLGKGTGLGLSMAFGTMKAHGGALELRSTPGVGTEAELRFPASRVQVPPPATAASSPAPEAGRSLTILLVDDDELIREAVGPMLEALGHEVRLAAGGQEALDLLARGLEVDLVILDMNMPGITGAETLPRILVLRPGQRVIMASGYSDQDVARLVAGRPGVESLRKPYTMGEIKVLLDAI